MPRPRRAWSGRSTKPKQPVTLKHLEFYWREPNAVKFVAELMEVTGYNTDNGVLTFFLDGKLLRSHAPGFWAQITVLWEEPLVKPVVEAPPIEEPGLSAEE